MKHTHRKARIGLVLYILICMIFYALSQGASEIWAQESTAQAKTGDMTVTIYHTNDMHGALAASESSIGIDKVAAIKENTPGSILVDAGDATQGLPLASLTKGADVIKLMNIAGYDAMALGNHELDYGTTQLLQNASSAAFPILAANVFYNGSLLLKDTPSGNTGCHTIIERTIGTKTVKIGFFGLTTRETAAATNPTGIQGVTFEDEIQSAKKEIDELKKEGAEKIVALAHLGEHDTVPCTSKALATALTGEYQGKLDVIIDGHSHTKEGAPPVNDVLIQQTGTGLTDLGKVELRFSGDGKSDSVSGELLSYGALQNVTPKAEVTEAINNINDSQKPLLSQKVCAVGNTLWGGTINNYKEARITETNLGDLAADAYRWAGENFLKTASGMDSYRSLPVAAVENGGGIRASLPNGQATAEDLITVFPFSNTLMMKEITPKLLYEMLERSVSNVTGQDKKSGKLYGTPDGGFLQISGFSFSYDPAAAKGSKVQKVTLEKGGRNVSLDRNDSSTKMILVSNDFLMSGGNDFSMLKNCDMVGEIGGELETLRAYIEQLTENGKKALNTRTAAGRIQIAGEYRAAAYTAAFSVKNKDQSPAEGKVVSVYMDGQPQPVNVKTDNNGIARIKVADGPHGIALLRDQKQIYVNNYTGAGLEGDAERSIPAITYQEPQITLQKEETAASAAKETQTLAQAKTETPATGDDSFSIWSLVLILLTSGGTALYVRPFCRRR
ncbi:bifunctional UDP-sugar hydrolase/5'-nucleotidase [Eubacteriales bacterium DFI.9.88]|nr:bifunctional UDP-sugar hydrolase/5'-nucleotidase [Eubacteriales bacterium DFI.9.88]